MEDLYEKPSRSVNRRKERNGKSRRDYHEIQPKRPKKKGKYPTSKYGWVSDEEDYNQDY